MSSRSFPPLSLVALLVLVSTLALQPQVGASPDSYPPTGYNLLGATAYVSGELPDFLSDNGVYMTFRSYYSGTDTSNFVDNDASDVDSSADKGTHGNFSAQQYGPDSIYDTLTEENTASVSNTTLIDTESFEGAWPPTGWIETGVWNKESDQAYDGTYSADFEGPLFGTSSGDLDTPDLDCSDASAIYVDFWYRDDDLDADDFLFRYYDGSNWDTISDLGSTTQEDQWLHYQEKITDSQYFVSTFKVRWSGVSVSSGESTWVDYVTIKKEVGTFNYELDLEVQWTNADYDETSEELAIYVDKGNNTYSLDATGGYMIIGNGTPNWGSLTGTISFWIRWNSVANRPWGQHDNMETRFSGSNLVIDWGAAGSITSSTSFTPGKWYFIAIVWDENTDDLYLYVGDKDDAPTEDTRLSGWTYTVSTVGVTENNFMASRGGVDPTDGHGEELRYWNIDRTLAEIQSDYDTELTGSETNLRSYFKLNNNFDDLGLDNNDGSGSGSYLFSSDVPFGSPPTENIRVDVWNGPVWQNLFTDLTSGWNNASVSPYLTSSNFTIRFKGSTETNDTTQDTWNIDAVLLHVWSEQYTAEVEFSGSSNTYNWKQLNWTFDSAWTISSVDVSIQLYNYTLGDYPTSGNGFTAYTSSATANTDETKTLTITTNPQHFRDVTGNWKIEIKGVKNTTTQFDFKADWVKLEPTHARAQPFNWITTLLYALPLIIGFPLLLVLILKRKKKTKPRVEKNTDVFSQQFGITHQQMKGKKMLFEIDPASDNNKDLLRFISEAKSNSELLFILTNRNSTLHSESSEDPNVNLLLLTSETSSPMQINERETLLPASDLSVLLDSLDSIQRIETEKTINVVFDNLSDIILRCGLRKTYKFMRLILEAISSSKVTALFLFNPTAHGKRARARIRSMFQKEAP